MVSIKNQNKRTWKIIKVWKVEAETALKALELTKKVKHNRIVVQDVTKIQEGKK